MERELSAAVVKLAMRTEHADKLFRVDTAMPAGCPIKAKLALRAVGYEGIYHLPGCGAIDA